MEREAGDGSERSSSANGSASALLFEYEGKEEDQEGGTPVIDFATRFVAINLYMPDAIPGIDAMALPPMMLGQVGGTSRGGVVCWYSVLPG